MVQQAVHPDALTIFGATFDENMDDEIRVTVIATGFDKAKSSVDEPAPTPVRASAPAPQPVVRQTQYANRAPFVQELKNDGEFIDVCPDPNEMPPITEVPYKFVTSPGKVPESCPLPDQEYQRKAPTPITFTWKASSLCYKPLYFEDVQLERYGHYCHPLQQPVCSRVRFWLTIPCLPYLMGVNPPRECIYDLGYYRPGNCAPSMIEPIPISLRGGLMEAGTMVGLAALIP